MPLPALQFPLDRCPDKGGPIFGFVQNRVNPVKGSPGEPGLHVLRPQLFSSHDDYFSYEVLTMGKSYEILGSQSRETDMASFKYFATHQGQVIELANVFHDGAVSTKANHFIGVAQDGSKLRAERKIERKTNPSMHKCDARCLNATGHLCECSCGGKNHGAGQFRCEAA